MRLATLILIGVAGVIGTLAGLFLMLASLSPGGLTPPILVGSLLAMAFAWGCAFAALRLVQRRPTLALILALLPLPLLLLASVPVRTTSVRLDLPPPAATQDAR